MLKHTHSQKLILASRSASNCPHIDVCLKSLLLLFYAPLLSNILHVCMDRCCLPFSLVPIIQMCFIILMLSINKDSFIVITFWLFSTIQICWDIINIRAQAHTNIEEKQFCWYFIESFLLFSQILYDFHIEFKLEPIASNEAETNNFAVFLFYTNAASLPHLYLYLPIISTASRMMPVWYMPTISSFFTPVSLFFSLSLSLSLFVCCTYCLF